jgi:hypothetical protein
LSGVVADPDTYAAGVRGDIVNPVRDRLSKVLVDEVMHVDLVGTAFRTIVAASVLEAANQFLLLGVDRNHWLTRGLGADHRGVDVLELRVPVRVMAAFQCLAVHLAAVFQQTQQFRNAAVSDLVTHTAQGRGQLRMALRDPH